MYIEIRVSAGLFSHETKENRTCGEGPTVVLIAIIASVVAAGRRSSTKCGRGRARQ